MADLSRFWRNQRAALSAEYDQKAMMAREIIAEQFSDDDADKIRAIINHFATDQRAMMALMGVLAQVGLCALFMEDCTPMENEI